MPDLEGTLPLTVEHSTVSGVASEGAPPENVDWSSVEQVAGHVSRTTLTSMQQLWRTHSATMDSRGKQFAETVYSMHAQAIKEVASMRTFDLKQVLAALNTYTAGVRETVLGIFQVMRQSDDNFAQSVYQTSRRAFARTLREALEVWDGEYTTKVRSLKEQHAEELAMQRRAAEAHTAQRVAENEALITKTLNQEHKRKMTQAMTAVANLALQKDQEQQEQEAKREQAQAPSRTSHAGAALEPEMSTTGLMPRESSFFKLPGQDTPVNPDKMTPRSPRRSISMGYIASKNAGPTDQGSNPPPNGGGGQERKEKKEPGASALGLEVLSLLADDDEDSRVNNALVAKELEVQLKYAKEEMQEQKARVEEMNRVVMMGQADVNNWKDKWIQEGAKCDGIKRECLQIVIKCEQRVTALQQEHLAEMSKRDLMLQRAKDTIVRLEAHLAGLNGGQHLDMRELPLNTPIKALESPPAQTAPPPSQLEPQAVGS